MNKFLTTNSLLTKPKKAPISCDDSFVFKESILSGGWKKKILTFIAAVLSIAISRGRRCSLAYIRVRDYCFVTVNSQCLNSLR